MKGLFTIPFLSLLAQLTVMSLVAAAGNLPFDSLPNINCQVPSICSGHVDNIQCRCDDTITVCLDEAHHYCWGSQTLHRNTNCPSVPTTCSSAFNSTPSCLCNDTNVLCVDQYSHVCYGNIQNTGGVSLIPLGGLPPANASTSTLAATSSVTPSSTRPSGSLAATSTPVPNSTSRLSSSSLLAIVSSSFVPTLLCITLIAFTTR
ncbi:hypothetical protein BC941DRAFT_441058 [Chlamydoabsidia padenii]|nr:hypothetical protein BC941DRAFT_441058 [Chlamydoabsidia padenii]